MKKWKFIFKNSERVYSVSTDSPSKSTSDIIEQASESDSPKESWIKCRYAAILMGFMIKFFFFAHRNTINVSIVDMVNYTALHQKAQNLESCMELVTNLTNEDYIVHKKSGEFVWTPEIQGYILGVSFLFSFFAIFPGGKMCEIYGCKRVMIWSLILSSAFNFVSPFAAWCHVYLLILVQGLRGLFQGCIVPGLSILVANWAPKDERALMYSIIHSGAWCGAVLSNIFSGLLCNLSILGGWPMAFFVIGGSGLITSALLLCYMYDNPSVHPTISQKELKYITDNQENTLTEKRPNTPWLKLLTSVPIWALAYGYFGQLWAISIGLTVYPTFLGTILHYPIQKNGMISALPALMACFGTFSCGWISIALERKKYMSVNMARKFFTCLSCFGCSACLLGVYFAGCNRLLSAIFAMTSLGFFGFSSAGIWVVPTDMSPTFAGSINSVMSISFSSNFIVPVVVGYMTNGAQTIEQWNKVFMISIIVIMSSGVVFAIFGSAEVQPWNDVSRDEKEETDKETKF